jgi:Domain of unknown function (DUF3597)
LSLLSDNSRVRRDPNNAFSRVGRGTPFAHSLLVVQSSISKCKETLWHSSARFSRKLGFGGAAEKTTTLQTSGATPASPSAAPTASPTAKPVGVVDVVAQLEQRAAVNPQKLNWRTSIVDLLKLLDMDSSLAARKELAAELGCPPELMRDSAKMNMWLHKRSSPGSPRTAAMCPRSCWTEHACRH